MLAVEEIHSYYGLSHVLFGVSLSVGEGGITCLLGRNGAGKTTVLRSVAGLTRVRSGRVVFRGETITNTPVHRLVRLGISFVPDNRRIFPDLTVQDNLAVAWAGRPPGAAWTIPMVYGLFPALAPLAGRPGGCLSGGEQQMLSIARALLGSPRLLILDEPTEGLAPLVVRELEDQIRRLKDMGVNILMAEQNLKTALRLSDYCYVLDRGRVRCHGTVAELGRDPEIRTRYLSV
ncbi:MAG: ABC transporter ATP-binding protein [Peptococcaceae bacterium]|jgi:branched-chain amino acid transport system ATP-binding protein|nr:ABC transporter ATP-binding protein [Peptococcaceae bacterium]